MSSDGQNSPDGDRCCYRYRVGTACSRGDGIARDGVLSAAGVRTVRTARCHGISGSSAAGGSITALSMVSRPSSKSSLPSRRSTAGSGSTSRDNNDRDDDNVDDNDEQQKRRRRRPKQKKRSESSSASEAAADNLSVTSGRKSETAATLYQRMEMLDHRLLTRDEEFDLGRRIQVAASLRERISAVAEERRKERELVRNARRYTPREYRLLEEVVEEDDDSYSYSSVASPAAGDDHDDNDSSSGLISDWIAREGDDEAAEELFLPSDEELFELGMSDSFSSSSSSSLDPNMAAAAADADADDEDEEQLLLARDSGFTILDQKAEAASAAAAAASMVAPSPSVVVQEGGPFSMDPVKRDLIELTDEEVINTLGVDGGKDELCRILLSGAAARRDLMSSNIRLVVNISKKWMKGSAGQYSTGGNLRELYAGGWDRPSLDEVIQEGIVGLARAVDKYDYGRGMRFSTYATYWITSYVRTVFKMAKTGPLHVPAHLFDLANKYRKLTAKLGREDRPVPDVEEIAKDLGCSVKQLTAALTVTESLVSLDQPIQWTGGIKGSGAGEKGISQGEVNLADKLVW